MRADIMADTGVNDRFNEHNSQWLSRVFKSGGSLVDAVGDEISGWKYIFNECCLSFELSGLGRKCGENGGKRKDGRPCGRPAIKHGDGRCKGHPYKEVILKLKGNDTLIRPFPCLIRWEDVIIIADGVEVKSVDTPRELLQGFCSATHVYNELFTEAFERLGINPSCHAIYNEETIMLNPIWTSIYLKEKYPECVKLNGRWIVSGYNLEDYGVSLENTSQLA
jgi:hypothetical protein